MRQRRTAIVESGRRPPPFGFHTDGNIVAIYVAAVRPGLRVTAARRAWVTHRDGRLYATDNGGDTIDSVTGAFRPGTAFTAVTPCNANSAPSTCPAPPAYPPNYLGTVNLSTGQVSPVPVTGPALHPQGLIFAGG